jgi:hypothetical protein
MKQDIIIHSTDMQNSKSYFEFWNFQRLESSVEILMSGFTEKVFQGGGHIFLKEPSKARGTFFCGGPQKGSSKRRKPRLRDRES